MARTKSVKTDTEEKNGAAVAEADSDIELDEDDDLPVGGSPSPNVDSRSGRDEETVRVLFARLHGPLDQVRFGDRDALRDHLVLLHAPLVEHCARNFTASGEPLEDLVQEGYVGLIKAVDRFDSSKGVRFSTYACHLISGEIRHYLRDLGRLIHEPGWHFELRQRIARVNEQLTQQLSRAPEPEDIARALNIEPHTVREVLKNQNTLAVEYLDAESDSDGEDNRGSEWGNKLAMSTASADSRVDDQMVLDEALPQLKDLEKRAVTMHFFEDCSKTEVAKRLGISVNYAAYLIKRATERLRQIIESGDMSTAAPLSQQRTRATYLLELVKSSASPDSAAPAAPSGRANRRSTRVDTTVPAVSRRGTATLTEFVGWVDEEVRRATRYAQEFSVLWLRVKNWQEITSGLAESQQALLSIQRLTQRCSRDVDKVAMVSIPDIPGLHFLVLMPHTGAKGEITGQRWEQSFGDDGIAVPDHEPLMGLEAQYAFAIFPGDGKTADDLFRKLGRQLVA